MAYFGGGLAKKGLGYFARYVPWFKVERYLLVLKSHEFQQFMFSEVKPTPILLPINILEDFTKPLEAESSVTSCLQDILIQHHKTSYNIGQHHTTSYNIFIDIIDIIDIIVIIDIIDKPQDRPEHGETELWAVQFHELRLQLFFLDTDVSRASGLWTWAW